MNTPDPCDTHIHEAEIRFGLRDRLRILLGAVVRYRVALRYSEPITRVESEARLTVSRS